MSSVNVPMLVAISAHHVHELVKHLIVGLFCVLPIFVRHQVVHFEPALTRYRAKQSGCVLDPAANIQAAALLNVGRPYCYLIDRQVVLGFSDRASADARLDELAPELVFGLEAFFSYTSPMA